MHSGRATAFVLRPPAPTPQSIIESRRLFNPAQYHLALIRTDFLLGNANVRAWRRHRDQEPIRLVSFAYGFYFEFGMALVRYILAK